MGSYCLIQLSSFAYSSYPACPCSRGSISRDLSVAVILLLCLCIIFLGKALNFSSQRKILQYRLVAYHGLMGRAIEIRSSLLQLPQQVFEGDQQQTYLFQVPISFRICDYRFYMPEGEGLHLLVLDLQMSQKKMSFLASNAIFLIQPFCIRIGSRAFLAVFQLEVKEYVCQNALYFEKNQLGGDFYQF